MFSSKIPQSPLFVRTDSGMSDNSTDGFDSDGYDNDNDSLSSEDITPDGFRRQTISRHNTDISRFQITDGSETVNFKLGWKQEEDYSTDPFASNYRKVADWNDATRARFARVWNFVDNFIEKYESVEHAEFSRPYDQFRVLLQERGLYDEYERLCSSSPDAATRSCNVMNMLLMEAEDLIVRYAALEKLTRQRVEAMERGEKASWELAWDKRRAVELQGGKSPRCA